MRTTGLRAVALRDLVGKDDEGVVRVESLFVLVEPGVGERAPLDDGGMVDATTSAGEEEGEMMGAEVKSLRVRIIN